MVSAMNSALVRTAIGRSMSSGCTRKRRSWCRNITDGRGSFGMESVSEMRRGSDRWAAETKIGSCAGVAGCLPRPGALDRICERMLLSAAT